MLPQDGWKPPGAQLLSSFWFSWLHSCARDYSMASLNDPPWNGHGRLPIVIKLKGLAYWLRRLKNGFFPPWPPSLRGGGASLMFGPGPKNSGSGNLSISFSISFSMSFLSWGLRDSEIRGSSSRIWSINRSMSVLNTNAGLVSRHKFFVTDQTKWSKIFF